MMDCKLELFEAPEASDIIWENMGYSQTTIFRNTIIVWMIVIAFLNLIVFMFIKVHKPINLINQRYPPLRICEPLEEVHESLKQFIKYAQDDKENTINSMGRGNY